MKFHMILLKAKIKKMYKTVRYDNFNLTVFILSSVFVACIPLALLWIGFIHLGLMSLGVILFMFAIKNRTTYKKYKFLMQYEQVQNTLTTTNKRKYGLKVAHHRTLFIMLSLIGGYLVLSGIIVIYGMIF